MSEVWLNWRPRILDKEASQGPVMHDLFRSTKTGLAKIRTGSKDTEVNVGSRLGSTSI